MEELQATWKDRADFAVSAAAPFVSSFEASRSAAQAGYIAEAHPHDGWRQDDPKWDVMQPTTTEERLSVARDWIADLQPQTPQYVDPIENATRFAFAALPERLYILEDGVVQYQGGRGPFDYHPEEVESWLEERFAGEQSASKL